MQAQNLDMQRFFPEVLQVIPGRDFSVYAYMNDGTIRHMDIKPLIVPGTVFAQLADEREFVRKLAVINQTVAWDMGGNRDAEKCIDLDPFSVYEAPSVPDPLEDGTGEFQRWLEGVLA